MRSFTALALLLPLVASAAGPSGLGGTPLSPIGSASVNGVPIVPSPFTTSWGTSPDRTWLYVDTTNGSDASGITGLSAAHPFKTLTNAVAKCSPGGAIFLFPGLYNQSSNSVVMPTNSWLFGAGTNSTIVFGFADLQGNVGAQIVPRDNCWVNNLQVQCDTNSLDLAVGAGLHSGSWSGIGFTQDSLVPYKNISPTNWAITHVFIWKAMFDSVHMNQNLPWSLFCDDVTCDGVHGFNFLSQNGTSQDSFATLRNCKVIIRDNVTSNVLSAGAYWFPAFLDTDTYIELHNCCGYVQTNGNGNIGAAGFPPQMFILDGSNGHGTNTPNLLVDGGTFKNPYFASLCEFNTQTNTWGYCNQNGTNLSRFMIGKAKTVTSGNALEVYGAGTVLSNLNANTFSSVATNKVAISATGYTNTLTVNGTAVNVDVYFKAATAVISDSAGTTLHTFTALTTEDMHVVMKPNWRLVGTSMAGDAVAQ